MPLLTEQAVIVRAPIAHANAEQALEALTELEDQLNEAIRAAQACEPDGNEMSEHEFVLYMYGPDAEKLFSAVESLLRKSAIMKGAIVALREGPPGSASQRIVRLEN